MSNAAKRETSVNAQQRAYLISDSMRGARRTSKSLILFSPPATSARSIAIPAHGAMEASMDEAMIEMAEWERGRAINTK